MLDTKDRTKDWVWDHKEFAKIFGEREKGNFGKNWPKGKRLAVALTFDTQADVDAAIVNFFTFLLPTSV
ncbi:MAG: hypothetical protein ACREO5_15070, partial [Candidatus Binatia bacterium]